MKKSCFSFVINMQLRTTAVYGWIRVFFIGTRVCVGPGLRTILYMTDNGLVKEPARDATGSANSWFLCAGKQKYIEYIGNTKVPFSRLESAM